ncbi:hypothetical protein NX722_17735 [Endozoicomonas gorgoniicola]|uniref:Zinc ribbon domain-containing protein n=1 Tax=Endozoicomonas gorgoniicola TaxID=1234144 RepID=A0ABT3MZK6_9GAMM|nr:hypothetical protein [Endozoicomonas gorgoniicola]MCW7554429.1 hypothetical protein [Endozoicomonas gorgoniicola]
MKQHKSFSQFMFYWLTGYFCLLFTGFLCSPVAHAFIQIQYTRGEPSIKTVGTSSNQEDDSYLINPGSILVEWLTTGKKSLDNQVLPDSTYIRLCFKSRKEVPFDRSKSFDPPHFTSSNNGSLYNEPSQGHNVSVLLKIQSVSGRDVIHYDPGKWHFSSDCASFTNNAKATEDEEPVPTQVVITTADDLPVNSSKNYLMPYEKPKQNSGKGDVYASGGAFDDGPDDKDDFWKRPGGGLERTLYEWSLEKLSIILTLTGLQPYKKQQRRPAIYLVVWHDGWRSTNIAIPVELWRVMVKRNHHQDPGVLRALSQNPVDPTAAYWQWVKQNPDLNKLYGTNPTLILDRLSLLALIPGKAPAPVRQPGGEQGESSGQSGEAQKTQRQTSSQHAAPSDKSINDHHGRGGKADDGDGDHPPSQNIKCMNCGKPVVASKSYCQDCLEQQEAAESPVQEKDNKELNEALKEATIFGDSDALLEAKKLIKQGATLEFSFIIEKLSEFIDYEPEPEPEPEPEMSIWSTLTSMFFQIMGYEPVKPVKERDRVETIKPWVDLWIKSHFIDIESEKWNQLILAGLKEEVQDTKKNDSYMNLHTWIKWLSKEISKTYFNDEFTNALKERKYWIANFFQEIGAEANQTYVNNELAKAVADDDVERVVNLMELTKTDYEPAMNLLLENFRTFREYLLLKKLIKRAQLNVLTAGLNHAFSTDNHGAINAMINLGGNTITSLITVELMQSSTYSYSAYIENLVDGALLSPGIVDTGLQHAISEGDDSTAKKWIDLGASTDADQLTKGLEVSAGKGLFYSAMEWVELGAKLSQEIMNKGLKVAAEKGDFDYAKQWVERGAKISQEIINKGVDAAINSNKIETARKWRELKPSPEQSQ